jgi:hypothetical protein
MSDSSFRRMDIVRPYSINLSRQNPTNHSRRHTATISGTKIGKSQQSYTMHSTRKLSTRIKATASHADQDGNASHTLSRQNPTNHSRRHCHNIRNQDRKVSAIVYHALYKETINQNQSHRNSCRLGWQRIIQGNPSTFSSCNGQIPYTHTPNVHFL